MNIIAKIQRKLMKLRLHPIRVFVVHDISSVYTSLQGPEEDWMSVEDFHHSIIELRKKYTFISIEEAMQHIRHDIIRFKDYAVLTADDGYKSVLDQLPWLIENNIPITLLINPKYMDGQSYSAHLWKFVHERHPEMSKDEFVKDRYITASELQSIVSPLISIGSHGYEHIDNAQMSEHDFNKYLDDTFTNINGMHPSVPFHAYPWGSYSALNEKVLKNKGICPLLADGWYNISDKSKLHREYLPKIKK